MSSLMSSPLINEGVLDKAALAQIWSKYPEEILNKLLLLMQKFDVVYPVQGKMNNVIKVLRFVISRDILEGNYLVSSQQTNTLEVNDSFKLSSSNVQPQISNDGLLIVPARLPKVCYWRK